MCDGRMGRKHVFACSVCDTIELDGKRIPYGTPGNTEEDRRNYELSCGYLSGKCIEEDMKGEDRDLVESVIKAHEGDGFLESRVGSGNFE